MHIAFLLDISSIFYFISAAHMTSPSNGSPSKNPISGWFRSLGKHDTTTSPSSNSQSATTTNNSNNIITTSSQQINNSNDAPKIEIDDSTTPILSPTPIKISNSSRKNSNAISLNFLSPSKSHSQSSQLLPSSQPQSQSHTPSQSQQFNNQTPPKLSSSPTPSRPLLGFKSRSSHSFRPLSQFLDSNSSSSNTTIPINEQQNIKHKDLRSHRDSFLQQKHQDTIGNSNIFGCDIETSTKHAFGTIYISSDIQNNINNNIPLPNTSSSKELNVTYGKVPLVIVSCGSYLKANALQVEGIFRLAGSNRRIKQLQLIFSTPPDYGAKIDWEGYTVHDAASILRRYLGSLNEPLIPFNLYDSFRQLLIEKNELLQYFKENDTKNSASLKEALKKDKPKRKLIIHQRKQLLKEFAILFEKLPPIQRRVLFYLLDMLAMFNLKSEFNRMPAKNLASIFQPSILFHPKDDMNPDAYIINSLVIESMITYSHKILTNVQNDQNVKKEKTKKEKIEKRIIQINPSNEQDINDTMDTLSIESSSKRKSVLVESNDDLCILPFTSSSKENSPLKNMITPLDYRTNVLDYSDFEAPTTSFSSPKANRSRPHSKSLSQAPHTEMVRIPLFNTDNLLNTKDETSLSRITSNQSGTSSIVSSRSNLISSSININNTDNTDTNMESIVVISEDQLAKELGLPPNNDEKSIAPIPEYMNDETPTPITPIAQTFSVNEIDNNTNNNTTIEESQDDQKSEEDHFIDAEADIDTESNSENITKSSNSLAFSFQPSMNNEKTEDTSESNVGVIDTKEFKSYKVLKSDSDNNYSITDNNDDFHLPKTATPQDSMGGNSYASFEKKEVDSNENGKINNNLNSIPMKSPVSSFFKKSDTKEKKNWLEKFKPKTPKKQ